MAERTPYTLAEGGVRWRATGPENRADLTVEGSTPSPSAMPTWVGWALASPRRCKRPASGCGGSIPSLPTNSGDIVCRRKRTWLNGRVPGRHPGGVGSTPAVRANPHMIPKSGSHFSEWIMRKPNAWEANLVKAPRRKRGEVGSKPTPGTIVSTDCLPVSRLQRRVASFTRAPIRAPLSATFSPGSLSSRRHP
jgi:hypothetical protein